MPDELELLPADDDLAPSADAELNAAVASALADPEAPLPDTEPAPDPTGYSWAFDFEARRFVRQGGSPARVTGYGPLKQRVLMILNAARYAHPVYSSEVGVERPNLGIGEAGIDAQIAADDWRVQIREALLADDEVADVAVRVTYDPLVGALTLAEFVVTTNEDVALPFDDIRITVED
jgi:hypothetical protein